MNYAKHKIFISWSGKPSQRIASALRKLLLHLFDNVEPFVSADDLHLGRFGVQQIHSELAGTSFGILIVTTRNQHAQWLNFEAGSLARSIPDDDGARVVPLLIDFQDTTELTGPISGLQWVRATEIDMNQLIVAIGMAVGVGPEVLRGRWQAGWQPFADSLALAKDELAAEPAAPVPERSAEDMLAEILRTLRVQASTPKGRDLTNETRHRREQSRGLPIDDLVLQFVSEMSDLLPEGWAVGPILHQGTQAIHVEFNAPMDDSQASYLFNRCRNFERRNNVPVLFNRPLSGVSNDDF